MGEDVAGIISRGRQRSKQRTAGHTISRQKKLAHSEKKRSPPCSRFLLQNKQLRPTEAAVARPGRDARLRMRFGSRTKLRCQQRTLNPHFGTGGLRKRRHAAPKSRLTFCGRSSPPTSHTPSVSRLEFRSPNGNCTATAKVCHQHRFRGDRVR